MDVLLPFQHGDPVTKLDLSGIFRSCYPRVIVPEKATFTEST